MLHLSYKVAEDGTYERESSGDQSCLLLSPKCTTWTFSADFLNVIERFMQRNSLKWAFEQTLSKSCGWCVWMPASVWTTVSVGTSTCFCPHLFAYLICSNSTELNTRSEIIGRSIYRIMWLWVCVWLFVCTSPHVIVGNGLQGGYYSVEKHLRRFFFPP